MEFLKALLFSAVAVLAPIHALLIVTGILIVFDTITGIVAAKKRGERISSSGFKRTVIKMTMYQIGILSGFLLETYILGNLFPVSKMIAGAICVTETKSILENASAISGKNILKEIIEKLGTTNKNK